jgi:hypothetical protein
VPKINRTKNPRYLNKKGSKWYVTFQIPKDVRHDLRFLKNGKQRKALWLSTKTSDQHEAVLIASSLVAELKTIVHEIRTGKTLTADEQKSAYRTEYKALTDASKEKFITDNQFDGISELREEVLEASFEEACNKFIDGGWKAVSDKRFELGKTSPEITLLEALSHFDSAEKVLDHIEEIKGLRTPFLIKIEQFKLERNTGTAPDRNLNSMISTIESFAEEFPYIESVTKQSVKQWIHNCLNGLNDEVKVTEKTIQRRLSQIRSYWRELQEWGEVSEDNTPLLGFKFTKKSKKTSKKRLPFNDEDAVVLLDAAKANIKDDPTRT